MAVDTKSELVVDRSAHGELLRMNFNISFPALSCEFATLDVSDALGTVRGRPCRALAGALALLTPSACTASPQLCMWQLWLRMLALSLMHRACGWMQFCCVRSHCRNQL